MLSIATTHHNHYVPIWYQKRFLSAEGSSLFYLDLNPEKRTLPDGRVITLKDCTLRAPKSCFWAGDLYTTTFFNVANDEIEKRLFGVVDSTGSAAVRALIDGDLQKLHRLFGKFFEYLDAQKLRTPKGLDWIRAKYPQLSQLQLMLEMQHLRQMHCTMWVEAVREIVSAEDSDIKFIITDHPVTIYNPACPPESSHCRYPDDPSIALKGSQTIFPLDLNHCLVLTNLEYARKPDQCELLTNRTHARHFGQTISRFDTMIRVRKLKPENVIAINYLLKTRARRFIAASTKEWLYPEDVTRGSWAEAGKVLLPPTNELWHFGGEIYVGYKDGSTHYQDEFGRTTGDLPYLRKKLRAGEPGPNDPCVCGNGRKYKKCCRDRPLGDRPSCTEYSTRERNIMFFNAVTSILGLTKGKSWDDVRRELSDEQVKQIHLAFGSLWPKETNIADLLPRPDNRVFRVLYMGLLDPRTIAASLTSFLPYFDEIVVLNPFMNPAYIRDEFSPTHSPSQHKQQTLKNILVLLQLIPFIEAGIVHMVPDPCEFNAHLREQIWSMAKARLKNWKPSDQDMEAMIQLSKDDFRRTMSGLPDDALGRSIRRALPELPTEKVEQTIEYMKKERAEDPLALLQPMIPGEKGGQYQIWHLSPNLELGLFLAQITGSAIYTDVQHRWNELQDSVDSMGGSLQSSPWELLAKPFAGLEFIFEANPAVNLEIRRSGRMGTVRNVFRRIGTAIQTQDEPTHIASVAEHLVQELNRAHVQANKDWAALAAPNGPTQRFKGKVDVTFPSGGFGRNTVHRLLVSFGGTHYSRSVPMAMLFKAYSG